MLFEHIHILVLGLHVSINAFYALDASTVARVLLKTFIELLCTLYCLCCPF